MPPAPLPPQQKLPQPPSASSLLAPLTVYAPTRPKVRLGSDHDGGYVLCALDVEYDHFLSGGIGSDSSFERAVLDAHPSLSCDAYDPKPNAGLDHPRLRFHQAPLGYHGLATARNALVKIDIEGDEWPWFSGLSAVSTIAQLVMELHYPDGTRWNWSALAQLADTHYLVHLHGNNNGPMIEVDGTRMPWVLECTWIRKDLDPGLLLSHAPIPSQLDRPNAPRLPDMAIDWPPFCHPDRHG